MGAVTGVVLFYNNYTSLLHSGDQNGEYQTVILFINPGTNHLTPYPDMDITYCTVNLIKDSTDV